MDTQSVGTPQSPSTFSESSKSGSTGDGSVAREKDPDLTVDNATSPIDLECHIQAERITKILDEVLYKTKLALCLPGLVQEYRTLSSLLSKQHMDDLEFIFEQYDSPLCSTSLLNTAALDDIKAGDVSLKNRLNPELGHLLYIMNSYPALKPKIDVMVQEMKEESVGNEMEEPRNMGLDYLETLEQFRELMVRQLHTTAAEELAAKFHTRKLEASNEKLLLQIKEYTASLKEETDRFEETMVSKSDTIKNLEQELAFLNQDATVKLKKKILDSDRQMVLASRAHAVKSEMLKEEEAEFKVETQLLSWLQKYDIEMGDKQVELDEFTQKYDEEVSKCEELEKKLAEQDVEYIPLMAEREAEYQQELMEKMNKFMMEHAARVIQNAWREVLANRAEKKKLKKLLKKIQAAAAISERKGGKGKK
ncbi:hypothetical protein ACJJTC_004812 [Scirpophaga incertulas]